MAPVLPVNPIPPVVVALALGLAGVEAVLSLADAGLVGGRTGIGWRAAAVADWAFAPSVWEAVVDQGNRSWPVLRRFVTYAAVHGDLTHALFAVALLLALGKFVGETFSQGAVIAAILAGTLLGAVAYGLLAPANIPLIGAYPAVYGLIGAFTYALWLRLGERGGNRLRAFRLIGLLMALQLLFAALFGGQPSWIADVAGFAAGFAVSPLVAPGGFRALRDRLRARG